MASERDVANRTLADAIRRIEGLQGNDMYRKAWDKAVRVLQDMMIEVNQTRYPIDIQSIVAKHRKIGDV